MLMVLNWNERKLDDFLLAYLYECSLCKILSVVTHTHTKVTNTSGKWQIVCHANTSFISHFAKVKECRQTLSDVHATRPQITDGDGCFEGVLAAVHLSADSSDTCELLWGIAAAHVAGWSSPASSCGDLLESATVTSVGSTVRFEVLMKLDSGWSRSACWPADCVLSPSGETTCVGTVTCNSAGCSSS